MKNRLYIFILFLGVSFVTVAGVSGCTEKYKSEAVCSYKELFGFATMKKVEKSIAYFSFTIQDASGFKKQYGKIFEVPAPKDVVTGTVYPAKLLIRQTGTCSKHRLVIIQDIGSTCHVNHPPLLR